ncbi:TonB-dependent receptor [Bacteroidia bacterium]|nr:TonB-dependent receptor [Bacteroidia bacterium]
MTSAPVAAAPATGNVVHGALADSATDEPLSFATVSIKTPAGRIIGGVQTNINGKFEFTNMLLSGNYILSINLVGYPATTHSITIADERTTLDVGFIKIKSLSEQIADVVVSTNRNAFTMEADKDVYDANQMEGAAGGTAADLLAQIPSLEIDADDNMQMRGKTVTITIDGRPSPYPDVPTTLQMLPADMIERVEVISNPSASYQSDGEGGIVNIVLKQGGLQGYNGTANLSVARWSHYNGGISINYKKQKYNLFAVANGRYSTGETHSFNERRNYKDEQHDTMTTYVLQPTINQSQSSAGTFKVGFDYFLNPKSSFTLFENISLSDPNNNDLVNMDYYRDKDYYHYATDSLYRSGERRNTADNQNTTYQTEARFKHEFDSLKKHVFNANVRHIYDIYDRNTEYITEMDTLLRHEAPKWQKKMGGVHRNRLLLKADYTRPVGEKGKFATGLSANNQWNTTVYDAQKLSNANLQFPDFAFDSTQAEDYNFIEQIYSGYAEWSDVVQKFSYKVGLRAETTLMDGNSWLKNNTTARVDKSYFYVFPSAMLTYYFTQSMRLSLSYSSRISRPSFLQLVPYTDVADLQNIRLGSPDLLPSRTHNIETKFYRHFEGSRNTINADIYYWHTQDMIQSIVFSDILSKYVPDAGNEIVSVNSRENAGRQDGIGTNLTFRLQQIEKLTLATTIGGNYNLMQGKRSTTKDGVRVMEPYTRKGQSGRASLSATYKFPMDFVLSASARYNTSSTTVQGSARNYPTMDMNIRKYLFDKTLTLTLAAYDVLGTAQYTSRSSGVDFETHYEREWNSRQVRLSVSYKFGKMEVGVADRNAKQGVEHSIEPPPKKRGL